MAKRINGNLNFLFKTYEKNFKSKIFLKKKGYSEIEIETIFSRYDKDADKKLNEIERLKLVKDIAKAKNNLKDEYKNFKDTHKLKTKRDAFE